MKFILKLFCLYLLACTFYVSGTVAIKTCLNGEESTCTQEAGIADRSYIKCSFKKNDIYFYVLTEKAEVNRRIELFYYDYTPPQILEESYGEWDGYPTYTIKYLIEENDKKMIFYVRRIKILDRFFEIGAYYKSESCLEKQFDLADFEDIQETIVARSIEETPCGGKNYIQADFNNFIDHFYDTEPLRDYTLTLRADDCDSLNFYYHMENRAEPPQNCDFSIENYDASVNPQQILENVYEKTIEDLTKTIQAYGIDAKLKTECYHFSRNDYLTLDFEIHYQDEYECPVGLTCRTVATDKHIYTFLVADYELVDPDEGDDPEDYPNPVDKIDTNPLGSLTIINLFRVDHTLNRGSSEDALSR